MRTIVTILTLTVAINSTNGAEPQPVSLGQMRRQVTAALGADALAKSDLQKRQAIARLVELYSTIQADSRYKTSDTLKGLRIKVWSRLDRVRRKYRRQLAREGRPYVAKPNADEVAGSIAAQISQMSRSSGGVTAFAPTVVVGQGGGAANFAADLIAVIERTISPQVWDVHGGPASIAYYPPVHALVIRATDEVHYDVAHLLTMLRAANGP